MHFHQDTVLQKIQAQGLVFNEWLINTRLWPSCFPEPIDCNFCLWRNLKQKVYRNNPCTLKALQIEIQNTGYHCRWLDRIYYLNVKCVWMLQNTTFSGHCNTTVQKADTLEREKQVEHSSACHIVLTSQWLSTHQQQTRSVNVQTQFWKHWM